MGNWRFYWERMFEFFRPEMGNGRLYSGEEVDGPRGCCWNWINLRPMHHLPCHHHRHCHCALSWSWPYSIVQMRNWIILHPTSSFFIIGDPHSSESFLIMICFTLWSILHHDLFHIMIYDRTHLGGGLALSCTQWTWGSSVFSKFSSGKTLSDILGKSLSDISGKTLSEISGQSTGLFERRLLE